jgi:hypothetical protein
MYSHPLKQKDHAIIRKALSALCNSSSNDAAGCSFRKHEVVIREGKVVEEMVKHPTNPTAKRDIE